jgi:hypothetical protein
VRATTSRSTPLFWFVAAVSVTFLVYVTRLFAVHSTAQQFRIVLRAVPVTALSVLSNHVHYSN